MYLIQILLPQSFKGEPFPATLFNVFMKEWTERFGGVTAYTQSPAQGLWKNDNDKTVRDEMVLMELVTENIESEYWKDCKQRLCEAFEQQEVLIRSIGVSVL